MKLIPAVAYPTANDLLAASVGTAYVYRRYLIFGPEPVWFAVVKLGTDRWVRAQSTTSLDDALAVIDGTACDHTTVVDDVDSKAMAKLVARKEVEADGNAEHVGLMVGAIAKGELPQREERARPDAKKIAAARRAAASPAGATTLATILAGHQAGAGATKQQLSALARTIGRDVPPDLAQLLTWSNGHRALELMSVDRLIEMYDATDRADFLPLNENENGDYWGLILKGPLRGALAYGDYDLDDPDADAIKAESLAGWLAQVKPTTTAPRSRRRR